MMVRQKFFFLFKVNSAQEVYTKFFAVHILKFEILHITWKNGTKNISFSSINLAFWYFLFYFFIWFARFQVLICETQASCTELTLPSVKFRQSRKQIMHSSIFLKNKQNSPSWVKDSECRSFLGRMEETIICLRDLLTFYWIFHNHVLINLSFFFLLLLHLLHVSKILQPKTFLVKKSKWNSNFLS